MKDNHNNIINSELNLYLRKKIIVPDDYLKIQDAINAANDGDIIEVREGIYNENIVVNKMIKISGDGYRHTFIDGSGLDDTVKILRDGVEISFFTIRNSCLECAGLFVDSHYNTIIMNAITENGYGIFFNELSI